MRLGLDIFTRRALVTPRTAATVAGALLLLSLAVGLTSDHSSRLEAARAAQVEAEILAGSLAGALAFDDRATAQQYIDALRANPAVEVAAAYDVHGRLVASLQRGGDGPPRRNTVAGPSYSAGRLRVSAPVVQGDTRLGSVYLRLATEPLARRLTRYLALAAIITMASLLIVVLGSSHARLREAHRRLQAETAERQKAEEALRHAQKLEAMGQLTGGVAHDFNNLLMVASSGLELMDRTSDPARRERLKEGIRQAIERGASLTQQLLAFARRAPVKPEVLSPAAALRGMLNLLERSLGANVAVRLQLAPDLWPVEIDPSAFEIAILNLAINARDAMPHGGVITISAENVAGTAMEPADAVQVCVTDTGVGLAAELAARVFEPFFTTKGVGRGTGLGLSQVYGFAKSSRGDVSFTSEEGVGTTVCMRIPRTWKTPVLATIEGAPAEPDTARPRRLLMVEDDDTVAGHVLEMLAELGWAAARASNAAAALDILQSDSAFDVVFSDMMMPGEMNGLELAREIAVRLPGVPVVLTTGYSAAAVSAAAEGMRLLVKPYRMEALAQELAGALASKAPVVAP